MSNTMCGAVAQSEPEGSPKKKKWEMSDGEELPLSKRPNVPEDQGWNIAGIEKHPAASTETSHPSAGSTETSHCPVELSEYSSHKDAGPETITACTYSGMSSSVVNYPSNQSITGRSLCTLSGSRKNCNLHVHVPTAAITCSHDTNSDVDPEDLHTLEAGIRDLVPCGLANLGNTCYTCMNAALQCLGSVIPLRNYFMENPEQYDSITSEISHMFQVMWKQCPQKVFRPGKIMNELGKCSARFSGGTQQDSQEFLIMLLEKLHDGMKTFHSVHEGSGSDENPINEAEKKWREYLNRHGDSVVADIFEGQFQSAMECGECNKVIYKFDPFMFLSVPVPSATKKGTFTLDDCFESIFKEEMFSGKLWCCSRCGQKADMKRTLSISRLPEVLMIYLKRFQNDMYGGRSKVNTNIQCKLRNLDFSNFMSHPSGSGPSYNLFAVINHSGSIHGGHYTAYGNRDGKWYHFNDDWVRQCSETDVKSQQAYVLFYQKEGNEGHQKCTESDKDL